MSKIQGTIQIDAGTTPQRYFEILNETCKVVLEPDPCLAERAIKNETQINLCRDVQTRDAVAVVEFLTWFYKQTNPTELTEIDLVKRLWEYREKQSNIRDQVLKQL